ncbi:MAG: ABC transporter ATP-binding protein [Bacilli bacterium]|nr:ABC transporter ATP-binding protein [Bacilli bacterium]
MKKLLRYLKPYWKWAIFAPIFMIAEVVLDLIQPKFMENIVDNGILNEALTVAEKTNHVLTYGAFILIALAIGGFCGIMSAACASTAANSFGNDLRKDVFAKVVNLSFEQTDNFTTGSLVTRITNDITQVQDFISMAIRMFVRTLIMFFGGILFMFFTNKIFALILAIAMVIQFIAMFFILRKAIPTFGILQTKVDKVNSVVQENVNGVRVVKAYTQEENEKIRFDEANTSLSDTSYKVMKLLALIGPIITIVLNAVIIAIIYFGGLEISKNVELILAGNTEVLTVGKLMSGLTYVSMVLMSVMMLVMVSQFLTRAEICAKRINEVLESDPVINNGENKEEATSFGTVEFKDVTFSYPNSSGVPVVKNLNLTVNKGDTIAILGATGAGKSSIVNLIPRFYDVTEGSVLVDGKDVRDYDLNDLRNRISIVLQRTELFGGTITENIRWGKEDATLDEIRGVTKIAQADDFIMSFANGYDTIVGERGSSLSGGQKQRIAISRALIRNPEILIFDDSTSALDLATEAKLYKALRETYQDTTIILIAQRVASAKNAKKIAVIDKGELVAFDSHENLMKSSPIYQDIYNSQLKRGDDNE